MFKKLLTLAAFAAGALGGLNLHAQTDVTSTYITNADFSSLDGWTAYHSENYHSEGNGQIGTYVVTNSYTSTTDATHLASEYCIGLQCRWQTNFASYNQTKSSALLPAGSYTITFDVENANTNTTAGNSSNYDNLFYVQVGATTYSDTYTEWMDGSTGWTTHTISFTIEEETEADFKISFGYGLKNGSNWASGSTPHLYVSHLKMTTTPIVRPTTVTLSESSLSLTVGGTSTLTSTITPADANTDTDITWASSDATVATVDNGVVTAVGPGTATITATTANNVSATCSVTVTDVAEATAPSFYSEIAAGDFYIVNAATGKYLGGANSWGTQASLIEHGIPFTVALNNGTYTLDSHTYNSANSHFLNGTFVDGTSTNLYITSLGNGKYSISTADGSAFLTANINNTTVANTAPTANSVLAQWYFVSKDNRDALLASATDASPADATYYLTEANISRNLRKAYNTSGWTGAFAYGGNDDNQCAERYKATTNVYQTVSVPNGKYTVSCQGFYRQESGSDVSYLYANDEEVALTQIYSGGINNMAGASTAFSNGEYTNSLTVYVTDGSLKVGIKCDAATNWTIWDNFEISYHGPTIAGEAEALPETAMTADKWYYFDVDIEAGYDLTAAALSDIVYTTDGTILIENEATVTANFSGAEDVDLTAGRYYVKSASEQTFVVAPHSYNYEIGDATLSTVDGGYTQSSTFTVTFPGAATNDPEATAALVASSTATVNGESVSLTATEGGFSLDLGTLTAATAYAISIPAGVYGYASGETYNEAISLTVNTPTVFDGEYCLYDAAESVFLGRGCSWGTEAAADKYGIPFNLVTDESGVSSIEFVDNTGVYLFSTSVGNAAGMYTDNASTGWTFVSTTDGYYLKDANGDVYAKVDNGGYGYYLHTVEGSASATVWTLKTKAERDAIIAAYPTENINNVIAASGISTTANDFATYLSDNYNAVDATSNIGTATFSGSVGDWTWSQVRGQDNQPAYGTGFCELWNATGTYSQTIDKANLPAGIYKVTVQGYERRKANDAATALYTAGYNLVSTFLSANGEQVRFTDWNDVAGKPTNTGAAVTAFDNGEATNEVYVYLDGNTDLTITVKKPNYIWDCWAIFNNFTLTRYEQASATMSITDAKYATFIAPFDVTIPDGVTASTATSMDGNTIVLTDCDGTIPANTPVVLYSEEVVSETFAGKSIAEEESYTEGLLTGVYTATTAPVGSYVLQNLNSKVAFYKVAEGEDNQPTVGANRAYLTAPASGVKAIYFPDENEATAIDGIAALTSGNVEGIYTTSGAKVNTLQKGVNIVKTAEGKTVKVLVK